MLAGAMATVSCVGLKADHVEIVQLGIVEDSVTAGARQLECGVKVLSDRDYSMSFEGGNPSWLRVARSTRDTLSFVLEPNLGFRRCAYLDIMADGRADRVQIRQEGQWQETVALSETSLNVPAEGYTGSVRVISNMPSDYLKAVTTDMKALADVSLDGYILHFTVLPSHSRDARTLSLAVEYVNGWDELVINTLTISQEAYE